MLDSQGVSGRVVGVAGQVEHAPGSFHPLVREVGRNFGAWLNSFWPFITLRFFQKCGIIKDMVGPSHLRDFHCDLLGGVKKVIILSVNAGRFMFMSMSMTMSTKELVYDGLNQQYKQESCNINSLL